MNKKDDRFGTKPLSPFGIKVRELLKENEITQTELGEIVGVSGTYITRTIRGDIVPSVYLINAIVDLFSLSDKEKQELYLAAFIDRDSITIREKDMDSEWREIIINLAKVVE